MTEKRFTLIDGIKKGTHSGIWDKQKQNNQRIGDELWIGEVVSMLNEGVMVAEANEQLKSDVYDWKASAEDYLKLGKSLKKENEQLKQDKKRLIGFLHRYGGVDVEDVDEKILSKKYFDEWGNLYSEFKDGDVE